MAYRRKPNYHFRTTSDLGIHNVPNKRIVLVEDVFGETKTYFKLSDIGITETTTILEFINSDNSVSTSVDETNLLFKDNTDPYTPSSTYHPATKGYVDAMASSSGGNVEITKGYTFTGDGTTTTFDCGADDSYILGSIDIYHNGIQLDSTDYTAADGRTFTLDNLTPETDDIVKLVAYGGADVYNKTQTDTLLNGKQNIVQSNYNQNVDVTVSAGAHTFDFAQGDAQKITAAADFTLSFSGFISGKVCTAIIDAVNWGSYVVTFPTGTLFSEATAPEFTSGLDRILIYKDQNDVYSVFPVGYGVA